MDNLTQPVSSAVSSETLNGEADLKGSYGEGLDQQKCVVKQKEAELKEMQDQIETYNQMVKQLTSQREMAVKKLADMDTLIQELTKALETERIQVEAKDKDLKTKRSQLQTLKNEENELTEKTKVSKRELDATTENLSNTQMQEAQVKTKLEELQQFLTRTNAAMDDIDKAISIKDTIKLSALCSQLITPPPLSVNSLLTNGMRQASSTSPNSFNQQLNASSNDNNNDSLFDGAANFDPFVNDDPFDGDDPFKSEEVNLALPEDDPFNPSSSSSSGLILAHNDPFAPQTLDKSGF